MYEKPYIHLTVSNLALICDTTKRGRKTKPFQDHGLLPGRLFMYCNTPLVDYRS